MMVAVAVAKREECLASIVEDGLTYITCSSERVRQEFGGALMFTTATMTAMRDAAADAESEFDYERLPVNRDVSFLCGGTARDGSRYMLAKARQLSYIEKQKLSAMRIIGSPLSRIIKTTTANLAVSGAAKFSEHLYAFDPKQQNNVWAPVGAAAYVTLGKKTTRTNFSPSGHYQVIEHIECGDHTLIPPLAQVAAWMRQHMWHVQFSQSESAGILFSTNAIGVKGLFQCRDKPEGRDRRAALLHWVRKHWRKLRRDPDVEIEVKEHLRGQNEFDWFGLRGQILLPMPADTPAAHSPAP